MGAWIEIQSDGDTGAGGVVAPLVGAWIEIMQMIHNENYITSLLSWERGLKSISALVRLNCDCRSSRGSVD